MKKIRGLKSLQLPGAGSTRVWHHHGSHKPTSPRVILLHSYIMYQPKHFHCQCNVHNVGVVENLNERSSNTLLRLVRFSATQTLYWPIHIFQFLKSVIGKISLTSYFIPNGIKLSVKHQSATWYPVLSEKEWSKGQLNSEWMTSIFQNSNENIVRISALKVFVASWGLPGSFWGFLGT